MVILVKRFFKFYFDVDITGVRSEIIEESLSHDGIWSDKKQFETS